MQRTGLGQNHARSGPDVVRYRFYEILTMAFGTAESELLGIVANEGDALGRVYRPRAQVARLDPSDDQS
jgi:hypothetical protein